MKSFLVAAVLLFVSTQLHGEPQPWMKSDEPETLRYSVQAAGCSIPTAALDEIVTGVLIRSRLKPRALFETKRFSKATPEERAKYYQQERFGFSLFLECMEIPSQPGWFVYAFDLEFLRFLPEHKRTFVDGAPYGAYGIDDEDGLKAKMKEGVEKLVTDYLQANFDLTPE